MPTKYNSKRQHLSSRFIFSWPLPLLINIPPRNKYHLNPSHPALPCTTPAAPWQPCTTETSYLERWRSGIKQKQGGHPTNMSKMSDLQQFRVRTPSFLMIAENPAQVWHTSILNKLDQVVATSYTRNPAQVSYQNIFRILKIQTTELTHNQN